MYQTVVFSVYTTSTCRGYQRLSEVRGQYHVCFCLAAGDGFPVESNYKLTGFRSFRLTNK